MHLQQPNHQPKVNILLKMHGNVFHRSSIDININPQPTKYCKGITQSCLDTHSTGPEPDVGILHSVTQNTFKRLNVTANLNNICAIKEKILIHLKAKSSRRLVSCLCLKQMSLKRQLKKAFLFVKAISAQMSHNAITITNEMLSTMRNPTIDIIKRYTEIYFCIYILNK